MNVSKCGSSNQNKPNLVKSRNCQSMKNVMRLDEGFYPIVHYRGDSHGVLTIFCCQHPTHGDLETDFPCVTTCLKS